MKNKSHFSKSPPAQKGSQANSRKSDYLKKPFWGDHNFHRSD